MKLRCTKNDTTINLSNNFILGRKSMLKQLLADEMLSREHCIFIIKKEKEAYITDLGSTNKTFLNGKELKPEKEYRLSSGDEIQLGHQTFVYYEGDAAITERQISSEQEISQIVDLKNMEEELNLDLSNLDDED